MGLFTRAKSGLKKAYEKERQSYRKERAYQEKLARQLREVKRKAYAKEMKRQVGIQVRAGVKAKFKPISVPLKKQSNGEIDRLLFGGLVAKKGEAKKKAKSAVEKALYAKAMGKEKKKQLMRKIQAEVREKFKTPEKVTKPLKGNGKKDIDKMLYGGGYY